MMETFLRLAYLVVIALLTTTLVVLGVTRAARRWLADRRRRRVDHGRSEELHDRSDRRSGDEE